MVRTLCRGKVPVEGVSHQLECGEQRSSVQELRTFDVCQAELTKSSTRGGNRIEMSSNPCWNSVESCTGDIYGAGVDTEAKRESLDETELNAPEYCPVEIEA